MIPPARIERLSTFQIIYPSSLVLSSRVAWLILDCARRTSTFLSCAFREQEDDQAARPLFFSILLEEAALLKIVLVNDGCGLGWHLSPFL